MDVTLGHKQQPEPIGCMYYAVWAFTKDDSLLEHVRDLGEGRFRKRLAERGILLTAMFEGRYFPELPPLESETWERIRSHAQYEGWPRLGLLVIIPSPRVQGNHMVAVQIQSRRHGAHVHVSDSALPEILEMTWFEFLKSPYAQAVAILRPDQDFPGRGEIVVPLCSGAN